MSREVDDCPHRRPVAPAGDGGVADCLLLRAITRAGEPGLHHVGRDLCAACSGSSVPGPDSLNPPLASQLYVVAGRVLARGGVEGCDPGRAEGLRRWSEENLVLGWSTSPPDAGPRPAVVRWAVGVLVAPRPRPRLGATLESLAAAGFDAPHLFAEPGSHLPLASEGLPVTRRGRKLGALGNYCASLAELSVAYPEATALALFHDDVVVAAGLRDWSEGNLWPDDRTDVVSLYTRDCGRAAVPGWEVRRLGYYRTRGAQAFVFRREAAWRFLASRCLATEVRSGGGRVDAAVGQWALESGATVAYHRPSLVQHAGPPRGRSGAADRFAAEASRLAAPPQGPPARTPRVGLIGWNTASGLGSLNRDLAAHLPFERWLAPTHPVLRTLPGAPSRPTSGAADPAGLRAFLEGLDWLLFCEHPYARAVVPLARRLGVKVACVPMWEYLVEQSPWLPHVDLMLCPTRSCYELVLRWRERLGLCWDALHLPWPVDAARFPFRQRTTCRRFLFVNGAGGAVAPGESGRDGRKGAGIVAEAARLAPQVAILVRSQTAHLPAFPPNVEVVCGDPDDPAELYREGDVCVQPSRWEGLGLPLLECQASGLPLVTTDAPPMNECRPLRAVRASAARVQIPGGRAIDAHEVSPADLARTLSELHGADVSEASAAARRFVEAEHSWAGAVRVFEEAMFG